MKRIYKIVSKGREKLFQISLSSKTKKLDPLVRTALADDVAEQLAGDDLMEIESDLAHAREELKTAQEKEQFLGVRSRRYRLKLDEQARLLRDEEKCLQQKLQQEEDIEDNLAAQQADLERRMEKWEKDQDALDKIVETHKEILVYCETMRRKIDQLEKQRLKALKLENECRDFVNLSNLQREGELEGVGELELSTVDSEERRQIDQQEEEEKRGQEEAQPDGATQAETEQEAQIAQDDDILVV